MIDNLISYSFQQKSLSYLAPLLRDVIFINRSSEQARIKLIPNLHSCLGYYSMSFFLTMYMISLEGEL